MDLALELAQRAAELGETPVGCVIVRHGVLVGQGFNRVEEHHDPTAHAEILALRQACQQTGDWRLSAATVYATLEPCIMCAAALIHARVPRIVYAAHDTRWGGLGSLFDLSHDPRINHEMEVVSGIRAEESARLLKDFFLRLRKT
jgi:tRNA(adenine34) deaminase